MIRAILRGVLAVITGYLIMMGAIGGLFFYLNRGSVMKLTPALTVFLLAYVFLFAFEGGYIAGWVGTAAPMKHAWALAGFTFTVWLVGAAAGRAVLPLWYEVANVMLLVLGILVGGMLRSYRAAHKAAAAPASGGN